MAVKLCGCLVAALLVWASPSWAAVSYVTACGANQLCRDTTVTSGTSMAATRTFTPGSATNTQVALVVMQATSASCAAMTFPTSISDDSGGNTWSAAPVLTYRDQTLKSCAGSNYDFQVSVWRITNTPVNTATTVTITYSAQPAGTYWAFGIVVFSGVNATTPFLNSAGTIQASGTTITQTVTTANGNFTVGLACNGTTTPTVANGQTSRGGATNASSDCGSPALASHPSTGTSFADTYNTNTADSSGLFSFDVAAASSNPSAVFLEAGTSATNGFEFWDVTTGTVSSATTPVHTGPRSGQLTNAGSVRKQGVWADAGRRSSFYFYVTSYPATTRNWFLIQDSGAHILFRLAVSSAGVITLNGGGGDLLGTAATAMPVGTWTRYAVSSVITSSTAYTINFWINGTLAISVTNGADLTFSASDRMLIQGPSLTDTAFFSDVYVDDGATLDDPGDVRVTAKLSSTVNANNFDTTLGTGAVNERPLSETNGKQQAASSQVAQNYSIEAASAGDMNVSGKILVASSAWIWSKAAATSGTPTITNNGVNTAITLTSTSALYTNLVTSTSYPSNAATTGMVSTGTTDDTFLYECGMLIAYLAVLQTKSPSGNLFSITGGTGALQQN